MSAAPGAPGPPEQVEVCPNDGTVAHFKCDKCGEEWYTPTVSMAHSNQRYAPMLRALKARIAELEAARGAPTPAMIAAADLDAIEARLKEGAFVVRRPLTPEQIGVINDVWRAQTALVAEVRALRAALTAPEEPQ